jgi:hypothetical protein
MGREREGSGTVTTAVELDDVLGVFDDVRGPVITSSDVADQLDCPVEVGRQTLRRLYNRGEVDKRETGDVVVWWRSDWVKVNTNTALVNEDSLDADREFTERETLVLSGSTVDDETGTTDQDRREFAAKLMATDGRGHGSEEEAVLRVLDKLADLARRAQRQGRGLLLTAGE